VAKTSKGLHVGWVLLAAAAIGSLAGVIIAEQRQQEMETEMQDVQRQIEKLTPMGMPLAVPAAASRDPMAPDPQSLKGLPPYPGAAPRRLMTNPKGQGVPMAVSWFSTRDSAETVLRFYERRFAESEVMAVSHRYNPRQGYVAWMEEPPLDWDAGLPMDLPNGVLHMVSALEEGSQTMVLVSASRPQNVLAARPPLPAGVAVPPGSAQPFVVEMNETGLQRQSIYVSVKMSMDDAVKYYEEYFRTQGYAITDRADSAVRRSLVAGRGDQLQVVVVKKEQEGAQLLITNEIRPHGGQEAVQ